MGLENPIPTLQWQSWVGGVTSPSPSPPWSPQRWYPGIISSCHGGQLVCSSPCCASGPYPALTAQVAMTRGIRC